MNLSVLPVPLGALARRCVFAGAALVAACTTAPGNLAESPPAIAPPVRIAIWDSGVDLSLFADRVARDAGGNPLVRGYNAFKLREDTPLAVLPDELNRRREGLLEDLATLDDLDGGIDSPAAREIDPRLEAMSREEQVAFNEDIGRIAGYAHGTNVADIALDGNDDSLLVVARMEWWHGRPPVPCWSRELADREAASMRDQLDFIVASGARVVNMSWGRFEKSYLDNLKECAPHLPASEREALARYSVEAIRKVLVEGMRSAPMVLFVGAAGNAGSSVERANPATRFSLPNFLLVGAVDEAGKSADYTNKGPEVGLYAIGERVPGRLPGGHLSYGTGTSMATPVVSNAAARMLAVNPALDGAELRALLERTADRNAEGLPLLNAPRAIAAARDAVRQAVAGARTE